jgi:tetratricopeptide (TPR) repeat protein
MERALLDRAIVGELRAALNEALRLKPDVAATLDSRGLTYLKMGQWDSAIDDYSSALRFDPKLASSLYGRGLAKLKKHSRRQCRHRRGKDNRGGHRRGVRTLWRAVKVERHQLRRPSIL